MEIHSSPHLNHLSLQSSLTLVIVQLLSHVQLFATPWTAAAQAPLSFAISRSLLKLMSVESDGANQTSHPLPSPSPPALNLSQHQIFSNELALCICGPRQWGFSLSISPSNEFSGLISFSCPQTRPNCILSSLKHPRDFHGHCSNPSTSLSFLVESEGWMSGKQPATCIS